MTKACLQVIFGGEQMKVLEYLAILMINLVALPFKLMQHYLPLFLIPLKVFFGVVFFWVVLLFKLTERYN